MAKSACEVVLAFVESGAAKSSLPSSRATGERAEQRRIALLDSQELKPRRIARVPRQFAVFWKRRRTPRGSPRIAPTAPARPWREAVSALPESEASRRAICLASQACLLRQLIMPRGGQNS